MVEKIEKVNIINRDFEFVRYSKNKLIFKSINSETNEIRILEIEVFNDEEKIKKIDIYTIEDEEGVESLHIQRGIDDVIEIDYYPVTHKSITIDGKKSLYKMNAYILYSENNDSPHRSFCKLELVKKGHKKCKTLTELPGTNNLFITSDNRFHHVSSNNLSMLKSLTKSITLDIKEIEKILFVKKESEVVEEKISEELIEELIENYPTLLYIYDRNYELVGLKNNALIYRNTEEDIIELEIYFSENKETVKEVRFVYYKDVEIEGIKNKSKKKTIRMINENNQIKASLCNNSKESVRLNDETLEKTMIKAEAIISSDGHIEEILVNLENELVKLDLEKVYNIGNYFADENKNEYTLSSYSYLTFKSLITFSAGIIRNIEKRLITDLKQPEKILIMNK